MIILTVKVIMFPFHLHCVRICVDYGHLYLAPLQQLCCISSFKVLDRQYVSSVDGL